MIPNPPTLALNNLLSDAAKRDMVTARRKLLLELLWHERSITRAHLIVRVEAILGKGCFGEAAWRDIFYRDMRTVKSAFKEAGFELKYSRNPKSPGYYLVGEPRVHLKLKEAILGAFLEIDPTQIEIYKALTPAQKFAQAASMIDFAKKAAAVSKHSLVEQS